MAASTAASTSATSTSASSSSSTSGGLPCSPPATCPAADKACIGLVSNQSLTKFGLRLSELDLTAPASFTTGIVGQVVAGAVLPSVPACNIQGSATFSWLLQFDTVAGTLKTGGARPVTNPNLGYSFDDEMITQGTTTFHIQPVTYPGVTPDAAGTFSVTIGQDLVMPIFLDAAGTSVVLLPMHAVRLVMGTLSSNQDCIGSYDAAGLQPANNCQPDATTPEFLDGGSLDGYITLEDADTVVIATLGESLCVLLSGNAAMYGMTKPGSNVTVCKRDPNNQIV